MQFTYLKLLSLTFKFIPLTISFLLIKSLIDFKFQSFHLFFILKSFQVFHFIVLNYWRLIMVLIHFCVSLTKSFILLSNLLTICFDFQAKSSHHLILIWFIQTLINFLQVSSLLFKLTNFFHLIVNLIDKLLIPYFLLFPLI